MASPKQIRQRAGWALSQQANVEEASAKMRGHLEQLMLDIEGWIAEPEEPAPEPEPEPTPEPEPEPEPVTVGMTTQPQFSVVNDTVRAEWTEAENATSYKVSWRGGSFEVDQTYAFVALADGDWLCVLPKNGDVVAADDSCNTYSVNEAPPVEPEPEPEPEPTPEPTPEPPSGEWTLVHEFSPAAGETIPDGVLISDNSNSERTTEGYLMTYPVGFRDGRGPGRIGIEPGAVPQGHRNLMCEYDITISADFEDHPVFNKIAHYRTKPPAREFDQIAHGAKFIDKFKNYRVGYAGDSGTGIVKEKFDPDADIKALYPNDYAGYNSVVGNQRRDSLQPDTKHTIRVEWTWVRQDETYTEGNWYRLRWWIDGVLQGDFPEMPMWGGPEFKYWEIAPTWGGNGGHIKTKEDYMLISRIKTWVR